MLLRAVDAAGIERLRFATSHPKDLTDEVIGLFATAAHRSCRRCTFPCSRARTASSRRMNRRYTREHYLGLIEKLRRARPDIALSTDIIVGIPRRDRRGLHGHLSPRGGSRLQPGVHVHLLQARGDACCGDGRRHALARSSRSASTGSWISSSASAYEANQAELGATVPVLVEGTVQARRYHAGRREARRTRRFTLRCPPARRRRLWWGASCP